MKLSGEGVAFPGLRRPPHGGRGLKLSVLPAVVVILPRRPPHGGRGLKSPATIAGGLYLMSPPARGAWVEI